MQTWIMAMITRKIVIPPFLALILITMNSFALNPLLIVLLIFATDVVTMSISTDRVLPSVTPSRFDVRSLMLHVAAPGILLMAFSLMLYWFITTKLFLSVSAIQTIIFCWLVFASAQATLYLIRARGYVLAKPYPSRWIIVASIFDICVVSIFATEGWLMTDISFALLSAVFVFAIIYLFVADLCKVGILYWVKKKYSL